MKKLLILILIFLTGCGIFYPNGFVIPDDLEFIETIATLETPEKIGDYMLDNFKYKRHVFYAPNPYIVWKNQKGDCNDFATFGTFIANYHSYKTYQIRIYLGNLTWHYIGVYVEDKYSFTDNQFYYYGFDTFREMVEESSKHTGLEWKSYKVLDYDNNLIEEGKR